MSSIWTGVPEMTDRIPQLQQKLMGLAHQEKGSLKTMLEDQFSREGKYLRGGFCLLAGAITGKNPDAQMEAASALEAFHLATLIHDDILDNAHTRRGSTAAHRLYGIREAVLLGDFLYSRALLLMTPLLEKGDEQHLAQGIMHICRQEISQTLGKQINWSSREYLRRAAGKTAALFALSLLVGARVSDANAETSQALRRSGYNLGMAFQIIDDILDVSPSSSTGKPQFQDFKNGLSTLPLILAVQTNPQDKENAEKALSKGRKRVLLSILENGDGLNKARKKAHIYTNLCFRELDKLPQSQAVESLKMISRKCLNREY